MTEQKKELQVTFNLKFIKKIIISLLISTLLLFAFQHLSEVVEYTPEGLNEIYPCEKTFDGSYNILYDLDRERNSGVNQMRCAISSTKLKFQNPISKKEYTTRETFEYLVIFPPNSTTGYNNDENEYKKCKDNIENAKSYGNRVSEFYLPSLIDHPIHILVLAGLIYFIIWIFTKFKFNFKIK